MKTRHHYEFAAKPAAALLCAALALGGVSFNAAAQSTDVASTPLITAAPNAVKPNIMFILDDSGSMGSDYMPDEAAFASGKYGRYASQCNGLAYNPAISYSVPVDSAGANMADGTYTFPTPGSLPNIRTVTAGTPLLALGTVTVTLSAFGNNDYAVGNLITLFSNDVQSTWMVGTITNVDAGNDRLTIQFNELGGVGVITNPRVGDGDFRPFYFTYNTYTGSPVALSYTYTTSGVDTTSTFYQQCNSLVGVSPGNGRFAKVSVTLLTITQNYRNWYTYYRTRMLTMRTAASQAFKGIGDKYRVGFSTISSTTVDGTKFLDTSDFDATQKATWYTRLFGSNPSGYTPLRGAVAKSGKYFAKRGTLSDGSSQTFDPFQFSCQKNFAILTTDGYWNNNNETTTYGPYKLDGTNVGQQDAAAARPMRDGGVSTVQERTSLLQGQTVRTQMQTATVNLQTRTGGLQTRTTSNGNSGSPTWSAWSNTASCTWDTSGNNRRECRYNFNTWTNAASCTAVSGNTGTSGTWTIPTATECQYTTPTYANSASCTPSSPGPSGGPIYAVASATLCNTVVTRSGWANVGSCTASATNECQYTAWTAYGTVASCTPAPRSAAPNYTVATARECQTTSTGGSSDSLADVAMYYYETDLRTSTLGNCMLGNGTNVCSNNVPPRGADNATHQHMTTFTVGLGVNGTLGYHKDYLSGLSPDFQQIIAGTKNWPSPTASTEAENIDDLWHAAVNGRGQYFSAGDPAVLARSLTDTLAQIDERSGTAAAAATSTLQPVAGDRTEYVTSYTTVQWVGDVTAYQINLSNGGRASTPDWSAQQLLDARVAGGTARNIYYMQRNAGTNTGTLRPFTYINLAFDGLGANFDGACLKAPALAQCATTGFDAAGANLGTNLVNWLRGQTDSRYRARQHLLGDTVGGAPVFVRKPPFAYTENNYQTFVSTINASNIGAGRRGVVYVPSNDGMLHAIDGTTGQELWAYVPTMVMDRLYRLADLDYATKHEYFVNATPVVGDIWVPPVGATPGTWKTILVGGLGAGGRGYFALDITDPINPKMLWEFKNDLLGGNGNLGLTFGNPMITKRANGQWVVAFGSGYNNVSPGDGNGRLFVVDANSGQYVTEVQTYTASGVPAGNATTPSGLAKMNNWVSSQLDNSTLRFYGGDLLGNVWRFDIDNLTAPNNAALRLAQLRAGSPAAAQPVTARPELAEVTQGNIKYPVVYIGTGKLLGLSDLSNTGVQSVYAIKDPLTNTPLGDVHARADMVAQTLTEDATTRARTVTNNPVDWATKIGWRVDLPSVGERVNIDMRLALTTLVVGANAPDNDACTAGGTSFVYRFNFSSGSNPTGQTGAVGTWLGNSFAVGVGIIQLPGGTSSGGSNNGSGGTGGSSTTVGTDKDTLCRIQMGDGSVQTCKVEPEGSQPVGGRRTSWRELVN
jgi:type IV pilus assembly protein PilY1